MKQNLLKLALCAMALLPIGAWADDTVVSTETTWDFSNLNNTSTEPITTTTFTEVTEDSNTPGLYYRAGNSSVARNIVSAQHSSTLKWNFAENVTISSKNYVTLNANSGISLNDNLTASYAGSDANNCMLAFTTGCAGTVYIAYRSMSNTSALLNLYYKASSASTYSAVYTATASDIYAQSANQGYVKYEAVEGGTFFFGGGGETRVFTIKFVPATTNKEFKVSSTTIGASKPSNTIFSVYGTDMILGGTSETFTRANSSEITGYTSYINSANVPALDGETGLPTSGTYYVFKPTISGTLTVAAMYPKNITTHMASSDKITDVTYTASGSNEYTTKDYELIKDKTYYFWGTGSAALRLFGFVYSPKLTVTTTIGSLGYVTFSSTENYDFSNEDGLTIYKVSAVNPSSVVLTSVDSKIIPANQGVILHGAEGSYNGNIVTSASSIAPNLLHASTTSTSYDAYNYMWILTANSANDGVEFNKMVSGSLAAGKAFLVIDGGGTASARSVVFEDGETTGISNVKVVREEGIIYNLNGTRIQNPGKGIYVKDGKKFIVK